MCCQIGYVVPLLCLALVLPVFQKKNLSSRSSVVSTPLQNIEKKLFILDDGTEVKQKVVKSKDSDKHKDKKRKSLTRQDKGKAKVTTRFI